MLTNYCAVYIQYACTHRLALATLPRQSRGPPVVPRWTVTVTPRAVREVPVSSLKTMVHGWRTPHAKVVAASGGGRRWSRCQGVKLVLTALPPLYRAPGVVERRRPAPRNRERIPKKKTLEESATH
eukprot:scaffold14055_cov114-Isochrysis_galbana.AAC.6